MEISQLELVAAKLKIEYSDDGGENFYDAQLAEANPQSGQIILDNNNEYQISDISEDDVNVETEVFSLGMVWDSKSVANGNGSLADTYLDNVKIKITPEYSLIETPADINPGNNQSEDEDTDNNSNNSGSEEQEQDNTEENGQVDSDQQEADPQETANDDDGQAQEEAESSEDELSVDDADLTQDDTAQDEQNSAPTELNEQVNDDNNSPQDDS